MSEFINAMYKYQLNKTENNLSYSNEDNQVIASVLFSFVKMIAPFVPHLAEELWTEFVLKSSNPDLINKSIHKQQYPSVVEELAKSTSFNLVLQLLGKKIDVIEVPVGVSQEELEKIALANQKIQAKLQGLTVRKIIVVPNKLVNIVAG
jgi:leucyl-tRNA synthetase